MRAEAAGLDDPMVAAARLVDAAQKGLKEKPRWEGAAAIFAEALEMAPKSLAVLEAAVKYHRRLEDHDVVADYLEKLAAATDSKNDRISILADLAQVYDMHLEQSERAIEIAEELLELDPTNPAALRAAEAKYSQSGEWDKLVEIYDATLRKMRRKPGEVELLSGLATMVWKRAGDLERAEGYFKRLKLADSKNLDMLRFYCVFYEEKQDWKRLLSSLQHLKGVIADEDEQIEIAYKMAEIAEEKLKNPAKAIDVWKQLLRLDSSCRPAREALVVLYERTRKWNALLELIKDDIAELEDDQVTEKIELYLRMVEIYRDHLRLDVMVINSYNAILEIDPNNTDAIDALAERYEQSKRWNDLLGILTRKAEAAETAEAVEIYWRIADLWRNNLGNTSKAIKAYEQIVELDSRHGEAISELHGIYQQRSAWADLFDLLEKEAALKDDSEAIALLEERAELAEKRLRDLDKAIVAWESVADCSDSPRAALERLEELYLRNEDYASLVGVYDRMLADAKDDELKLEAYDKLAQLNLEHLDDEDRAVEIWKEMAQLEGGQEQAFPKITEVYVENEDWSSLISLYRDAGLYEELYDILETTAEDLFDPDEQVELYQEMARIAEAELADDDKVVVAYEAILDIDGTHVETARALLPYYRKAEQPAKEAEANQIILAWTSDDAEALGLMSEIGRLYEEELSSLSHAFDWYGKAVSKAPERG